MILSKKLSLETEVEVFDMEQVAAATGGGQVCYNIPTISGHSVCGGDGKGGFICTWVDEQDDSSEYCFEY